MKLKLKTKGNVIQYVSRNQIKLYHEYCVYRDINHQQNSNTRSCDYSNDVKFIEKILNLNQFKMKIEEDEPY